MRAAQNVSLAKVLELQFRERQWFRGPGRSPNNSGRGCPDTASTLSGTSLAKRWGRGRLWAPSPGRFLWSGTPGGTSPASMLAEVWLWRRKQWVGPRGEFRAATLSAGAVSDQRSGRTERKGSPAAFGSDPGAPELPSCCVRTASIGFQRLQGANTLEKGSAVLREGI